MSRLVIGITLALETPLSVGAGGSAGTLADKTIIRDGWGRPIIPGSQVKGKLRWAAEQLLRGVGKMIPAPFDTAHDNQVKTWVHTVFGSQTHRSPFFFTDLVCVLPSREDAYNMKSELSQVRPSVSINRQRGVAEDKRLLYQEMSLEGMIFSNERAVVGDVETDSKEQAALLWSALQLTQRWGGASSRGLGWVRMESTVSIDEKRVEVAELGDALRRVLAAAEVS